MKNSLDHVLSSTWRGQKKHQIDKEIKTDFMIIKSSPSVQLMEDKGEVSSQGGSVKGIAS